MRMADCGNDVWIGDFEACDRHAGEFPNIIHIWRETEPSFWCACVREKRPDAFLLRYYEFASLSRSDSTIQAIADYCRRPGKLLIHCYGGQTRSATLVVLAKAVRGCDRFQAMADMVRAMRQPDYRGEPFTNTGLTEILDYAAGLVR